MSSTWKPSLVLRPLPASPKTDPRAPLLEKVSKDSHEKSYGSSNDWVTPIERHHHWSYQWHEMAHITSYSASQKVESFLLYSSTLSFENVAMHNHPPQSSNLVGAYWLLSFAYLANIEVLLHLYVSLINTLSASKILSLVCKMVEPCNLLPQSQMELYM